MAQSRGIARKPLVPLDTGRLLGMGHAAGVSATSSVDILLGDSGESTGASVESRVEMSKLFSRISLPPEVSPGIEQV